MQRIGLQHMVTVVAIAMLALPAIAQSLPPTLPVLPQNGAATTPSGASPTAPSNELPALNLPAIAAPATPTAASGLPAVVPSSAVAPAASNQAALAVVPAIAPPAPAKIYSYGDSALSVLFLPDQVNRMKDAIRTFEDTGNAAVMPEPVVQAPIASAPEVIEDPLVYPVFYLASIAYDAPKDWSLWISGYKITSRRNDTDVTVLSVNRDSATFLWTPSFSKAVARRKKDKLFAPVDPVKNKLAEIQRASFDAGTGSVVFTLKQNQSFAVGYFKIFEGYIDSPTLTALPVPQPTPAGAPVALGANGQPLPSSSSELNSLEQGDPFTPPSTNFNNDAGVPAN